LDEGRHRAEGVGYLNATTTAEADPYGMTNKRTGSSNGNNSGKSKSDNNGRSNDNYYG
jgi:hypothetical protein